MLSDDLFLEEIIKNKEHIESVYFSWGNFANGRNLQTEQKNLTFWEAQEKQILNLKKLNDNGIVFHLLFNATCYGKDSLSRTFYNKIGDTVDYILTNFNLSSVTTTSPLIAKFIKNNFAKLKTVASVNMEIGTIQGMDYISDFFDGYYIKREYNRDFNKIKSLKEWCDKNGKELHILANSGCLSNCSTHMFHDNLVAHEIEISEMDNCYEFVGTCHEYLKNPQKQFSLVRDTNFIRPEDISLYEPYFSTMKLATRVSNNPLLILRSYLQKSYSGNVLDLLEPNHASTIYPYVLENKKLTNDFLFCDKDCYKCNKCIQNYNNALVNLSAIIADNSHFGKEE